MNSSSTPTTETVVLAGGCFWGMQDLIRGLPGVLSTRVGYCGGTTANPTYTDVKRGHTGHAEAIQIEFDPLKLSLEDLLLFFFRIHDPTTLNRQGNDLGSQYRSVIFCQNATQQNIAEKIKAKVQASGEWKKPIVTEIVPAQTFYDAEDFHQDYLKKNPGGYTCHFDRGYEF